MNTNKIDLASAQTWGHRKTSPWSRTPECRHLVVLCLLILTLLSAGCNAVRWISTPLWPDKERYNIEAQYHGLEKKSIAVLVAADEYTLFRYPLAQINVCRAVSGRLAENIDSSTVMNPQQVTKYQANNPFWHTIPYGELIKALRVDSVVLIELVEYQTREPGNAHLWQGLITGNIGVIQSNAEDPDDFIFYTTVRARFPEQSTIGIVNADDASIRLGMHTIFSRDAAGLFYNHEVVKDRKAVVK